jgi:hypothetical protein
VVEISMTIQLASVNEQRDLVGQGGDESQDVFAMGGI